MNKNYQALIVGGGPAGVSAALYLTRANIPAAIIENGPGALGRAHKIENYYGASAGGPDLYRSGLQQAASLGANIIRDEVLTAEYADGFRLTLKNAGSMPAVPALILATGSKNISLNIPGLSGLEGRGVSYCAVCDGFFFRKKRVAVLGSGPFALHEAEYLKHLAESVVILTNGQDDLPARQAGFEARTATLAAIGGSGRLEAVYFTDNSKLELDGLFIALGTADSADLARTLGAQLQGRYIRIDADCAASIPGLFAAGDCTGGLKQIAKAVYEGALAGMAAAKYIRSLPKYLSLRQLHTKHKKRSISLWN